VVLLKNILNYFRINPYQSWYREQCSKVGSGFNSQLKHLILNKNGFFHCDSESYRWVEALTTVEQLVSKHTRSIHVFDREGDITEV